MNPNNPHRAGASGTRHLQLGLSLVELMVAITIGMLIVAALLALFLNITRNNSELAKTNAQIENGRFAMQLLENDVVHAGFWGAYVPQFDDLTFAAVPTDTPTDVPAPCLAYASWDAAHISNLIGIPVQAYDAAPAGCAVVSNKKADTDVLVVRHAETCLPGEGNCEDDTGKLYFQASLCELENATPYKLDTTGFTLHQRTCVGTPGSPPTITSLDYADKRKFVSNIYYVRDYAVNPGDGIPTLMRSTFDLSAGTLAHQAAQPLIEGIEGFRVEFDIDSQNEKLGGGAVNYAEAVNWLDPTNKTTATNRGDGIPDGASCDAGCTVAQLMNVVSAKLYVLARAKEPTPGYSDSKTYCVGTPNPDSTCPLAKKLGPFNDGFKRHVFSTSVRLNNISGRRETP